MNIYNKLNWITVSCKIWGYIPINWLKIGGKKTLKYIERFIPFVCIPKPAFWGRPGQETHSTLIYCCLMQQQNHENLKVFSPNPSSTKKNKVSLLSAISSQEQVDVYLTIVAFFKFSLVSLHNWWNQYNILNVERFTTCFSFPPFKFILRHDRWTNITPIH